MNVDLTSLDVKAEESFYAAHLMFDISDDDKTFYHACVLNAFDCVHMMSSCLLWNKKGEVIESGLGHHIKLIDEVEEYLHRKNITENVINIVYIWII